MPALHPWLRVAERLDPGIQDPIIPNYIGVLERIENILVFTFQHFVTTLRKKAPYRNKLLSFLDFLW